MMSFSEAIAENGNPEFWKIARAARINNKRDSFG